MDVAITNPGSAAVLVRELYTSIPALTTVTIQRSPGELSAMADLIAKVNAGTLTVTTTPTAAELASGLLQPANSVQAADIQKVAAADLLAVPSTIRKTFTAAAAGAPDDVTIYAANTLPFAIRIFEAVAMISTAIGASTITLHDQAAGAGQASGVLDSGSTGIARLSTLNASVVFTPGALIGLFLRRSDRGVAGEVFITYRREG